MNLRTWVALMRGACCSDPVEWVNPYCFAAPVAPALAAELEGVSVDMERISDCYERLCSRHDLTVVEGAGGALTPVFGKLSVADLAQRLRVPALIVSRAGLGTINHTVMTFECLRSRGVECLGFVLNRFPPFPDLAERTNADRIALHHRRPPPGIHPGVGGSARIRGLPNTFCGRRTGRACGRFYSRAEPEATAQLRALAQPGGKRRQSREAAES